jgi:predicted TIM-barrel fold metal-dependent hydrolase
MGFQAYGNSEISSGFWNRDWIPEVLRRPDINVRLDAALGSLYDWCVSNGVPIMAHSARSNAPTADFGNLSGAQGWRKAVRKFPGLRVNFGHFGETSPVEKGTDRAKSFMSLMNTRAGRHLYADSGYFTEAVSRPEELTAILRALFESTAMKGSAALAQRLLYGTDWEMIVLEGRGIKNYLKSFEQVFSTLDQDQNLGAQGKLSDRFFSANAANYLGLHQGDPNRTRLEAFYRQSRIADVGWMPKVDRCCAQRVIAREQ